MATNSVETCLAATPAAGTFAEPLDAILAEHFRQRAMCDLLDRLARSISAAPSAAVAGVLLGYLREQLPLHALDERDLFKLLRDRALAADVIEHAFVQLRREHAEEKRTCSVVIAGLERMAMGRKPENPQAFLNAARTFAEAQRRHVAYENNSILPLARSRLTPKDLSRLGRRMAARRKLSAVT